MKLRHWLLALCAMVQFNAIAATGPIVQTQSGRIEGLRQGNVDSFLGIPYARPPVGELRWQRPLSAKPWRGVKKTTEFGPSCMQAPMEGFIREFSEDCLTMNIWRPNNARGPLPVMVWIHGGGFVMDSAATDVYHGQEFANAGVILVSFDYRMGRLGFFAHSALEGNLFKGNYGLMDQIKALRWVQDNIMQFGGDPKNVTVFGESAGGMSVNILLTSRFGRDLFNRAIIQSGGGRDVMLGLEDWTTAKQQGENFAKSVGIEGSDEKALAQLRALPTDTLVGNLGLFNLPENATTYSGPMIDGQVIEQPLTTAYETGAFARMPLMVGATDADIGFVYRKVETRDDALSIFGDHAAQANNVYPTYSPKALAAYIATQQAMIEPARYVAKAFAKNEVPVWHFRFGYVASANQGKWPGAFHASDIPFVFNTITAAYGDKVSEQDQQVANTLLQYWVNFAKTGNPNSSGLPEWSNFDANKELMLWVAPEGAAKIGSIKDPQSTQLDLVEKLAQQTK
ncbi:carboxylesterase family protein [Shewanella avicenniae]|uniref:Carboxylic ester hydrolase n=1 Tax=Shewanella avicenniae TaxID=2814294 RepID=A0ABX7QLB1_9GAMM|nr:carboxylesterase family protein [Shewanella avicenniae]QSX32236.1 carboxylesterase family protein [Shewanella avicenniae]